MKSPFALSFLLVAACLAGDAAAKGGKAEPDPIEMQFDSAYASSDPPARSKAIDALRTAPDPMKFSILSTRVIGREKRADVVAHAVEILSSIKDEKTAQSVATASKISAPEARVVYVEALGGMPGSTAAHQMLLDLVKDKDGFVRGMAASGLGEHRAMDALEPLLALLDDKVWIVQAAALEALPRLMDKTALKAQAGRLVNMLENVSGRLRTDVSEALRRITGRNLGREPAPWRAWFDAGMPSADAKPEGEAEVPKSVYAEEKPHFYGIEVVSHRVVIVLDVSLTMYDELDIDKDRLRRETSRRRVVTGEKKDGSAPPEDEDHGYDIPWYRVKTRLDLAKYQTINLISQLREYQSFEIITFSKDVLPWMGKIVPATSANKQKAIAMLDTVKPEDATNMWGAIAMAFDMVDVNKKGETFGPDEMYLVTDGCPSSVGDILDSDQILEATLQIHKVKPLRINVIGIGLNREYLRKMARDTGGQSKFFTPANK